MKVTQTVVPVFTPVTLTFETLKELTAFVRFVGSLTEDDECIPFAVWEVLNDIVNGYTKS